MSLRRHGVDAQRTQQTTPFCGLRMRRRCVYGGHLPPVLPAMEYPACSAVHEFVHLDDAEPRGKDNE